MKLLENIKRCFADIRSKEYDAFVLAFDNIDVRGLTDNELKHYADMCENGLLEAQNELYKRGL